MMKVAILYICTGPYVAFWKGFYESFSARFLKEAEKTYFVFTDAPSVYAEETDDAIVRIPQDNLGWPGNTLYRFRMFMRLRKELEAFDYIFFLNANFVCKTEVTAEDFLPREEGLLVVQHPGNFDRRPYLYPYDRNKRCQAYVPYKCLEGKHYVCGGANGGKRDAYLALIEELDRRTDIDEKNGIIARWHDESQINRYIIDHPDYRMLTPAYCYPEGWEIPFEQRFLLLDKKNYIPLDATKTTVKEDSRLKRRIDGILQKRREERLEEYFRSHGL